MEKTSASVYIKKGQGRALKAGGLWIYDNEIDRTEGEFENGDMVNVFDFDGYPLGCGFINTRSTITIRMMSRKPHTVVDEDFIEMRVRNAWEYRKSTVDTGSCRLVFGEADFLPGIVIDKFSDCLLYTSCESLICQKTIIRYFSWVCKRREEKRLAVCLAVSLFLSVMVDPFTSFPVPRSLPPGVLHSG